MPASQNESPVDKTDGRLSPWQRLTTALIDDEKSLIELPKLMTDDLALVDDRFSAESLKSSPLVLRSAIDSDVLEVVADAVDARTGHCLVASKSCRVVTDHGGSTLLVDGEPVDFVPQTAYRVCEPTTTPKNDRRLFAAHTVMDGFMRTKLLTSPWRVIDGSWRLKKHGGGMPTTDKEMASHVFGRAVNPFSVSGHGLLEYAGVDSTHHEGKAAFYFGNPWNGGAVDKNKVPTTRFMIVKRSGKVYVGFGWDGQRKKFVIAGMTAANGDGWHVLTERTGPRPPISNWVSVGLQVRYGCELMGMLDGKPILHYRMKEPTTGEFGIFAMGGRVEFDDFSITPLGIEIDAMSPIFVKSRTFAGKRVLEKRELTFVKNGIQMGLDSKYFVDWACGASTYVNSTEKSSMVGYRKNVLLTRWPLLGEFDYRSVMTDSKGRELPQGIYEFDFLIGAGNLSPVYSKLKKIKTIRFVYDGDSWTLDDDTRSVVLSSIKFERRKPNDDLIRLNTDDGFLNLVKCTKPVYVAIGRVYGNNSRKVPPPSPACHQIRSSHRINELFETAPSDWSWIDGGFRMDIRWACAEKWNFMACGSTGVPMMVSKRSFSGDQMHDYFVTLRPMLSSDAGDPYFKFDFNRHLAFQRQFKDWMNKHDLNFSFCMDGRNPTSGYSIIFGDDDSGDTLLLRKGKIVERNASFRFPSGSFKKTHWKWWNLSVSKNGGRIRVFSDGRTLFDYLDAEPLVGGHVAFWTVRNGFILSKVTSAAETISWQPETLYVNDDDSDCDWTPLLHDAVTLRKDATMTKVTANVGCGEFAVRHLFRPTVILRRTPILELKTSIPKSARINAYLQIDDKAYVIKLNAPIAGCKALLTTEFEPISDPTLTTMDDLYEDMLQTETFQRKPIPKAVMKRERLLASLPRTESLLRLNVAEALKRLKHKGLGLVRSITIGNSSNQGYLQAGIGGNHSGVTYSLGKPKFVTESEDR